METRSYEERAIAALMSVVDADTPDYVLNRIQPLVNNLRTWMQMDGTLNRTPEQVAKDAARAREYIEELLREESA